MISMRHASKVVHILPFARRTELHLSHPSARVSVQQILTSSRPSGVQGWQWLDEDWHIDMTGHEDACVDNEGWYYAVDFNWLKHPPAPASGRFKRVCLLHMPGALVVFHLRISAVQVCQTAQGSAEMSLAD